jgi:carboxypeptidase D
VNRLKIMNNMVLLYILCLLSIPLRSVEAVRRLPRREEQVELHHGRRLFSNEDSNKEPQFSTKLSQHRREEITHPDDHLVTSLPLLADGVLKTRHWAGHLPASKDPLDKKIFYWLFEPANAANARDEDIPLILWLNGGPGCSSMDGLWLENGPLRLKNDGNKWAVDVNDQSWNNAPAWTLYVDQPVGTGLSFTRKQTYCKNDFEVNRDFHYFLEEFFLLHSDKFLSDNNNGKQIVRRPFYFSGESHAGHYIPSMMDFILQRNDGKLVPDQNNGLEPLRVVIPVSGAAIGNGWVDPFHQYSAADAAYGAGIIGAAQRANLEDAERACQSKLKSGKFQADVCFSLLDDIIDQSHGTNGKTIVSQYDTRIWEIKGASRSFPLGHKDVETYLGGKKSYSEPPLVVDFHSVLESIHALESLDAGLTYQECTDPPYLALAHQDGLGVVDELVRVLDHESKPHMLFFNGINDLICNHVGNERFLDALPWSKASEYMQQPRHVWDAPVNPALKNNGGRPDGFVKTFENLTYLKILEAGHMVPMDQPSVSLAMMKILASGQVANGFLNSRQQLDSADSNKEKACSLSECPNCVPEHTFTPSYIYDTLSLSYSDVGVVIAAFSLGVLLTCLFVRRQNTGRAKRELMVATDEADDLELVTEGMDSYRDSPSHEDSEFT